MDCEQLGERSLNAVRLLVERRRQKLAAISASLHALSPLQVLSRGFSLTQRIDGTIVRASDSVAVGDLLVTRVTEGTIRSRVEG